MPCCQIIVALIHRLSFAARVESDARSEERGAEGTNDNSACGRGGKFINGNRTRAGEAGRASATRALQQSCNALAFYPEVRCEQLTVGSELVLGFFKESVVCEAVGDAGVIWHRELAVDGVPEALSCARERTRVQQGWLVRS